MSLAGMSGAFSKPERNLKCQNAFRTLELVPGMSPTKRLSHLYAYDVLTATAIAVDFPRRYPQE